MRNTVSLVFFLSCVGYTALASPFSPTVNKNNDLILIPDTAKIDNNQLKELKAEKFLSLWFIHVLSASTVISDKPWTLLIPQNAGLPKRKDVSMDLLLGHAILEKAVPREGKEEYSSIIGTPIIFKDIDGFIEVNGIPVMDTLEFGDGIIFILESYLPLENAISSTPELTKPNESDESVVLPKAPTLLRSFTTESTTVKYTTPTTEYSTSTQSTTEDSVPKAPFAISSKNTHETTNKNIENSIDLASLFSTLTSTENSNSFGVTESTPKTSTPTFTVETTVPPKKLKGAKSGEWRATRYFDKNNNKSKPTKASKAKSLSTLILENASTLERNNDENLIIPKKVTSTTPKIPIINADHESDVIREFENVEDFGLEEEFGSGSINGDRGNFAPATFFSTLQHDLIGNHGTSEFLRHLKDSNIGEYFFDDSEYTGLIASDMAFYNYYPIDWGFNPFQVPSFTKDVILNHFIEGNFALETLPSNTSLTTLGGRVIVISRDENGTLLANSQEISKESDVQITSGRLYHLHQLLFVDQERVSELKKEYPYLETAPLLGAPWPTSQFLSHLLLHVSGEPTTMAFADYLNLTNIAHLAPSADENLDTQDYTAFVPTDNAIHSMLFSDAPDVFTVDRTLRTNLILNSIVRGRYTTADLTDGTTLYTLADTNLTVSIWPDGLYLNGVKVIIPEDYIYNLGAVFRVEGVLGITEEDIEESLQHYTDEPSIWKAPLKIPSNDPDVRYETRTEISVSQRVNGGEIMPVLDIMDGETVTMAESAAIEESVTVGADLFTSPSSVHGNFSTVPTTSEPTTSKTDKIKSLPHLRGESEKDI